MSVQYKRLKTLYTHTHTHTGARLMQDTCYDAEPMTIVFYCMLLLCMTGGKRRNGTLTVIRPIIVNCLWNATNKSPSGTKTQSRQRMGKPISFPSINKSIGLFRDTIIMPRRQYLYMARAS